MSPRRRRWPWLLALALPAVVVVLAWRAMNETGVAAVQAPERQLLAIGYHAPSAVPEDASLWLIWADGAAFADGRRFAMSRARRFVVPEPYEGWRNPLSLDEPAWALKESLLNRPGAFTFNEPSPWVGTDGRVRVVTVRLLHHLLPAACLPLIGLLLAAGVRWWRTRRRRRAGEVPCPTCGYDLRGTRAAGIGRCPECGTDIVADVSVGSVVGVVGDGGGGVGVAESGRGGRKIY